MWNRIKAELIRAGQRRVRSIGIEAVELESWKMYESSKGQFIQVNDGRRRHEERNAVTSVHPHAGRWCLVSGCNVV